MDGEVAIDGRWLTLRGERCPVHVVQAAVGGDFYTWCDDPDERAVAVYRDAYEAIEAGLRRAARRATEEPNTTDGPDIPGANASRGELT